MTSSTDSGACSGLRTVEITIRRCTNAPADLAFGLIEKKREYYVEITLGSQKKQTENRRRKSQQLEWNEKLIFDNVDILSATLSLYCYRPLRAPKLVGELICVIPEACQDVIQPFVTRTATFSNKPQIEFSIKLITAPIAKDETTQLPQDLQTVADRTKLQAATEETRSQVGVEHRTEESPIQNAVGGARLVRVANVTECQVTEGDDEAQAAVGHAKEALESQYVLKGGWKQLLEGIESFREITGSIAEVHPYAKIAHSVLFSITGPLIEQLERDEDVKVLFDSFVCFCDIVNDLKNTSFEEGKLAGVLKRVSLQMTEVAYFVSDYCKNKSFVMKALKHKISGVSDTIQDYRTKFEELKDELRTRLGLETGKIAARTEIKVMCVLREVAAIGQSLDLNDMPYVSGAGLRSDKECLVGTRQAFLEEIEAFVSSDGPRAMWIAGGAGTGKSSVAHTIAGRFRELGRLGSIFCFSEDKEATRDPASLFPHIARDLADLDPNIRAELAKAAQNKADRTTSDVRTQFDKLILIPANAIQENLYGPIVIVIDALDEAKAKEREVLLKVLATRLKELPPNIRVIITSRPDRDIEDALGNESETSIRRMHAIPLESTTIDIAMYVKSRLANEPSIDNEKCQKLASHAHGLFQWASVACDYIRTAGSGETPLSRYEELIPSKDHEPSTTSNHNKNPTPPLFYNDTDELVRDKLLDKLYHTVLSKFVSAKKGAMEKFKFVMARVLAAREPLSSESLDKFVTASRLAPKGCNVRNVVVHLGSLLSGVEDGNIPICPLHTSFRNFLTDKERSKSFFINSSTADIDSDMALASMHIMNNELKFNICGLSTSYLRNKDVPRIEKSIEECIPPHLSYACRFWAAHICSLPVANWSQPGIHAQVTGNPWAFLSKELNKLCCNNLPSWLEVLSLQSEFDPGLVQIRKLSIWLKACKVDKNLILLVEDIERFCSYFAKCITTSAPHIYISALPFAPTESLVAKNYIKSYNRTLAVTCGQLQNYPSCLNVLVGHTDSITSIAFSSDGSRIVSGSKDQTIRVWHAGNGEMVIGPLEGHTDSVSSAVFSPDGTRIISGSGDGTIRVWDAESGEMIIKLLEGNMGCGTSVVFSPDGTRIVTGFGDKIIRVWNAESGELVIGPLAGHTGFITSVAFSPDGTRIVSGSEDKTIRVWNAENGETAIGPSQGHTDRVESVSFSPDGTRIVSGSDKTIRVWNAENSELVIGPLKGHTGWVYPVAFSPDGTRIVSGSDDHTIRVWNASNGEMAIDPLEGHTGRVSSVSFSPDGTRIVSGAWDSTVRVWDAENGEMVIGPLEGHTFWVSSVSFSPDGTRIVSGAWDKTIRVWNAESGELVNEPLQGHTDCVTSVGFSPDGTRIVSGSEDHTVRIWNAENGEVVIGPLQGHTRNVTSVAFSPDGTRIVSGSSDKTIRVWNAENGEMIIGPLQGYMHSVASVGFSPDGTHIVSSSDTTVQVRTVEADVTNDPDPNAGLGCHAQTQRIMPQYRWHVKDGWSLGENGELLFYVPPVHQPGLCQPRTTLVISAEHRTLLDLSQFVHGTRWTECFNGSKADLSQ